MHKATYWTYASAHVSLTNIDRRERELIYTVDWLLVRVNKLIYTVDWLIVRVKPYSCLVVCES